MGSSPSGCMCGAIANLGENGRERLSPRVRLRRCACGRCCAWGDPGRECACTCGPESRGISRGADVRTSSSSISSSSSGTSGGSKKQKNESVGTSSCRVRTCRRGERDGRGEGWAWRSRTGGGRHGLLAEWRGRGRRGLRGSQGSDGWRLPPCPSFSASSPPS